MAKPRLPNIRSVQTPEALIALRKWLDTFRPHVRERGEAAWKQRRVEGVRAPADHFVQARVTDEEPYGVTLFYTRGQWSGQCGCPARVQCLHAFATGRAWIETVDSGSLAAPSLDTPAPAPAPTPVAPAPDPVATFAAVPEKEAFRARWAPVLAKKLGRPLTAAEQNRLENLAALFGDFARAHGTLYPGTLLRHGFEYEPPPRAPLYAPAFAGWWDHGTAPADPWALWQYIAYDNELAGRPIPEAFLPLTDTAAVRTAITERLVKNDLAAWKRALAAPEEAAGPVPTHPATMDLTGLRARVRPEGGLVIETRSGPAKSWRSPPQKWFATLATARPVDFEHFPPAEAALGIALAAEYRSGQPGPTLKQPLPPEAAANLFRTRAAREAIVRPDGQPLTVEPEPLALEARTSPAAPDRLEMRLVTPDGRSAARATLITPLPVPLYWLEGRAWRGPPPIPSTPLPLAALGDTRLMTRLRAAGLRLPPELERDVQRVALRPLLKAWLTSRAGDDVRDFHLQLLARAEAYPFEQHWTGPGWQWTARGEPAPRRPGEPLLEFDLAAAQPAAASLPAFALEWSEAAGEWTRPVGAGFPDEFLAWHATLPPGLKVELSPGLAQLLGPPLEARLEYTAAPAEAAGRDWFNLTVHLRVSDTTLTPEEISLLTKARGKWVSLPRKGWRRLELVRDDDADDDDGALERLGLDAAELLADGRPRTHRLHTLQLAAEAGLLEAHDAQLAHELRERARTLSARPPPPLPRGLRATLRPYQQEGFHFLTHLSSLNLGGVLADDMGLGKTVQTLAWLLHLAETRAADEPALRVLVVCPKSVTHGWLVETARFAPDLHAVPFTPDLAGGSDLAPAEAPRLLIANYAQLRIQAGWFKSRTWDAVVLDEGQFIKNPGSQVANVARALRSNHRLVLTGTPIENRLADLWSLFAFAQPGLLGTQSAFRRNYQDANVAAHSRLHRRVRHFLLRRTKAQAAPELPPRTEDDLIVELEGEQRTLYDAELKRARAQLLGIDSHQALAAVRFNVLSSLLRLRQICCHPALVDPAHRDVPSAKLEALLERLEELRDEGHQVLVFSQFVEMLHIIRHRLAAARIGHLLLTGQTENRAELIDTFQTDRTKTVFLLSLKAAGFGLNLTAASYAILYDPWWNPAAEAQAIDRTHRIGQTQPVVAYRLLAEGTVEEKIRALQRDKAALAAAVVQEESLASILDLDSLREILA